MVTPDSPHPQRVWRVKTGKEQYDLFKQSDTVDEFRRVHENRFVLPSLSTFLHYLCKCVKKPTLMSCVDVNTSSLTHYMRGLDTFIKKRKDIRERLEKCECVQHLNIPKIAQWQNHLAGRYHDFIEATCCPKERHPLLSYNVGSQKMTPHLLNWKCINSTCSACGIEKKMMVNSCPILNNCHDNIPLLEWNYAPRQGFNKRGKPNTQLELSNVTLPVVEVIKRLIVSLEINRKHQA